MFRDVKFYVVGDVDPQVRRRAARELERAGSDVGLAGRGLRGSPERERPNCTLGTPARSARSARARPGEAGARELRGCHRPFARPRRFCRTLGSLPFGGPRSDFRGLSEECRAARPAFLPSALPPNAVGVEGTWDQFAPGEAKP